MLTGDARAARQLERRRLALADAQEAVARCLEAETRVAAQENTVQRRIAEELDCAEAVDGTDEDVEAFGAWFKEEWARLVAARRRLENLQAETARERAILHACRVALERCERAAAAQTLASSQP